MALTPGMQGPTTFTQLAAAPNRSFGLPYLGDYPRSYVYDGPFPTGFTWGLGTAAYQIEGAWDEDGRGPSIWDRYSGAGGMEPNPQMFARGPVAGASNHDHSGAVACDHYHRFREDVQLLVSLGIRNYRFSISWPRVMPNGTLQGGVNEAGLRFYDELIDALLAAGIQPFITLYHWDLPAALQTRALPGWLDRAIVPHFVDFATLCFSRWGQKVKRWVTFNEPWTFVVLGYGTGSKAPGAPFADISINPYTAGHNVLLAHAAAVRAFRRYTASVSDQPSGSSSRVNSQPPQIGITNNIDWREPLTASSVDVAAAERAREWWLAWFCDPIWVGDYPESMRSALGDRLPRFNEEEKAALLGSADFFGLNHYGSSFVTDAPNPPLYGVKDSSTGAWASGSPPSYWADFRASSVLTADIRAAQAASEWLFSVPWGVRKLLSWIDKRYHHPPIYVTENGWSTRGDETIEEGIADSSRVYFLANYTSEIRRAIYEDGVDVRGYFAWSLMDNFEWERGYTERFGVVYTDFATLQRHPKASARWYTAVSAKNALIDPALYAFVGSRLQDNTASACKAQGESGELMLLQSRAERAESFSRAATAVAAFCAIGFVLLLFPLWLRCISASRPRQALLRHPSGSLAAIFCSKGRGTVDEGDERAGCGGSNGISMLLPRNARRRQGLLPGEDEVLGEDGGDVAGTQPTLQSVDEEEARVARVVEEAVREAEKELRGRYISVTR